MAEEVGRPTVMTPEAVAKLENAFAIGASIGEACYYADISRDTYYRWIKINKELSDKFERLKEKPILRARQTVNDNLGQPDTAKWYLERKQKKEFGTHTQVDHTSGGEPFKVEVTHYHKGDDKSAV